LPHGAKIMFLHDYSKDCNRLFGLTRFWLPFGYPRK
jgi:hypothetical protein